ncbi:MAG: aminopeptidase N [Bdellovibrionales bacterium]|nr:aminopeptidase N [Bdellovibrionales bacterium]
MKCFSSLTPLACLLVLPLLGSCSSHRGAGTKEPSGDIPLTQADAERRSGRITDIRYIMSFKLGSEAPNFSGTTQIKFNLTSARSDLRVDFQDGDIESVEANGKPVRFTRQPDFFMVDSDGLQRGPNEIVVHYKHAYSNSGAGLYRFKDPEDGLTYLYTDFEPRDASKLFPCFDQPDLKARYTLTAEVPTGWTVISSTYAQKITNKGKTRIWSFPESASFSTYLFSLHAGPYKMWKGAKTANGTPLRLFARQSFAKYVNPTEWFKVSRQGFDFYDEYFDYKYPFGKYDQVIVPDFNAGAMENVAAVTFAEHLVPRGKPSRVESEHLAEVILHEMAHMWFGNLVTMKWWDDVWLNESFATYMAALSSSEATDFGDEAWRSFFNGSKQWAYFTDAQITTHPIEGSAPDTVTAFANFDGITYGKGAAVIKQLAHYLSDDKFRTGVRAYFQRHAFGNATRADFTRALSEAAHLPLEDWASEWLQTTGANVIEASYSCADGKISDFEIHQSGLPLRTHRTLLGLYVTGTHNRLVEQEPIAVTYAGELTKVSEAVGRECPSAIYLNHGDYDYVRVKLDPGTIAQLKHDSLSIGEADARAMMMESLWSMVRETELSLQEYANLAIRHLRGETDLQVSRKIIDHLGVVFDYFPQLEDEEIAARHTLERNLESQLWKQLSVSAPGSDFQKLWLEAVTTFSKTEVAQQGLRSFLAGEGLPRGLVLDQDHRWEIVQRLSALGARGAATLRQQERERDRSSEGQQSFISAEAAQPDLAAKKKWLSEIFAPQSPRKFSELHAAMNGFFPREQNSFKALLADDILRNLATAESYAEQEFLSAASWELAPTHCEPASVQRMDKFLAAHRNLPTIMDRHLRTAHAEDERCVSIRALASKQLLSPLDQTSTKSRSL